MLRLCLFAKRYSKLMKRTLNIFPFFILCTAFGQNLVYNGNLEEYSSCPNYVTLPNQSPQEIEKCIGWKAPTGGTSDYYNSCSTNYYASVPTNSQGIQVPSSGDGYLGAFFYNYSPTTGMWWEYIQGKFVTTLTSGNVYSLKLKISLADNSTKAIDEVGILFTGTNNNYSGTEVLPYEPQCRIKSISYYDDKSNWIELDTIFVANGTENFLMIGNFNSNSTTNILNLDNSNNNHAYYYIDDIEVVDVSENYSFPNVFTPNNDQVNEVWEVPFSLENFDIYILNRWGNIVTVLDKDNKKWNGTTTSGVECIAGVYFFSLIEKSTKKKIKSGFIQLVR